MKVKNVITVVLSLLLVFLLVACGGKENLPNETESPKPPSPEPTIADKTQEPKATDIIEATKEPESGERVIFEDYFTGGELSDEAIIRYQKYYGIVDENLYLSYIGESSEWFDAAQSYAPDVYCGFLDGVNEYEYSIKLQTSYSDNHQADWIGCIIGVRVYEPAGEDYRPSDADSGLYVSILEDNHIVLYHGISTQWPKGACKVDLPEGFKDPHTLTIVDKKGLISYYMDSNDKERVLFMSVDMTGDNLIVKDANNDTVYSAENNLKDQVGYLKLFNHFAKTIVEEITIKSR